MFTLASARKKAYDFATTNDVNVLKSWNANKCAGKDWFTSFLKRNKALSLRIPEATSLARAMGFNRPVVNNFYDNLEQVLTKYSNVGPERIYNMDETGLTTVQGASKVIAPKGSRLRTKWSGAQSAEQCGAQSGENKHILQV